MGAPGPESSNEGLLRARALGATIRALRGYAHLSQEALGRRAGMHQNYLGALERAVGSNPGLEPLARIARGLDVSIAVLADSYAAPPSDCALRVDSSRWPSASQAPTVDAEALGRAIRLVRRARGFTQEQLASEIGIHRSYLGSIERGEKRNPGIASIARIARGLQRTPDEPSLLPLLAQTFTGETTVADVRATLDPKPSGRSNARTGPPSERDD